MKLSDSQIRSLEKRATTKVNDFFRIVRFHSPFTLTCFWELQVRQGWLFKKWFKVMHLEGDEMKVFQEATGCLVVNLLKEKL